TIIESNGLVVESNTFKDFDHTAIVIQSLKSGKHETQKNSIQNVRLAVDVTGTNYDNSAILYIQRNDIQNVVTAFDIKLEQSQITAIIRFNSVTGTSKLAKANRAYIDFTMNYWGTQELDLNNFEGIPERMLLGHYKTKNAIPSEASYNPALPTYIFITNPIEEIYLGTNYRLEWEYLPYELTTARFRVITTDAKLLLPTDAGYLTPLK